MTRTVTASPVAAGATTRGFSQAGSPADGAAPAGGSQTTTGRRRGSEPWEGVEGGRAGLLRAARDHEGLGPDRRCGAI